MISRQSSSSSISEFCLQNFISTAYSGDDDVYSSLPSFTYVPNHEVSNIYTSEDLWLSVSPISHGLHELPFANDDTIQMQLYSGDFEMPMVHMIPLSESLLMDETSGDVNESSVTLGKINAAAAAEREAKVLRYREKKKKRKFENKIRYPSKKACAETRKRIRGRFAKNSDSVKSVPLPRQ